MNNEIDIKSILGVVRRQFWLIFAIFVAITALGTVLAYSLTPKYTASALVLVEPSSQNLLDPQAKLTGVPTDNGRIESEVNILASDNIVLDVVRSQNLVSDPEFGVKLGMRDRLLALFRLKPPTISGEKALGSVLNNFKGAISVRRTGLTYLIAAAVTSKDPVKAALLTNALTDSYIRQQVDAKIASTIAARNVLQSRVESASAAIAENEKKFDAYVEKNMARLEAESGGGTITALRTQLDQITQGRTEQLARLDQANQSLQQNNLDQLVSSLQNDAIAELGRQRESLRNEISSNGADSPRVEDLRAQLQEIETSIKSEAPSAIGGLRQTVLQQSDERANQVREQLRRSILDSNLPPETLTEIFAIQQSSDIARKQYQNLLTRLQDVDAQSSLQLADSRVVSAALVPPSPSFPNRNLIMALAAAIALVTGLGLAVIREYFIGGFVDEGQVEAVLRVPLAAIAPRYAGPEGTGKEGTSLADGVIKAPLSRYAEAIRRLRAAIDHASSKTVEPGSGRVIMISSAVPGEGKSTLALSIARIYASSGKRTLLMDCDLRKPSVHRHIGMQPNYGFIDFLKGTGTDSGVSLSKLLVKDPLSDLMILLGGRRSEMATDDFFMDERINRLLSSAKKHFDYVILDTPPIDPVVDGLYLSRHSDAVAFIIKWATTSQNVAKRSLAALRDNVEADTPVLTILNQQDKSTAKYSPYSDYYSDENR